MRECPKCSWCHEDSDERCPRDGSKLAVSIAGTSLVDGKYRLERRLSQGGMGVVYLARHVELHRVFALKLIRAASRWDEAQLARFRLEAEMLGRLKHPGIVDVTDFGIDPRGGGLPYLVMEHLEGVTLMERCKSRGPLPIDEALAILAAVGRAVDFAHAHGVLHRDLKPANVFLCDDADGLGVKLLDFGLARLAGRRSPQAPLWQRGAVSPNAETAFQHYPAGMDISKAPTLDAGHDMAAAPPREGQATSITPPGLLAGTLLYMAPECFLGEETTAATDTYALGVTAYFVLVGRHPFEGSAESVMAGHVEGEPPRPSSIEPGLAPLLDEALLAPLAKQATLRPASAAAFVSLLEAAARTERRRAWWRRELPRRSAIAAAVAGLLMTLTPVAMGLGALDDLRRRSVDARLRTLPRRAPDPRLRLVVLDQASLDEIREPLGSTEMADELAGRLDAVFAAGARAVAVDLLLPPAWSRSEAFSRFVLRHQDALTLAAHVSPGGEVVGPEVLQGLTTVALGPEATRELFGIVNVETDADGVVRRAQLGYPARDGREQETWAARSARNLAASAAPPIAPPPGGAFWIDPSSEWDTGERMAWKDVSRELERQPALFSGALVLVGAELPGSGDEVHRVASGLEVPGVVVQAMTTDTILRGFPIREMGRPGPFGRFAGWLGLSCLALLVLTARRPIRVAVLGATLVVLLVAVAFAVFPYTRILVPVVSPVVHVTGAILLCLLLNRALSPFPAA